MSGRHVSTWCIILLLLQEAVHIFIRSAFVINAVFVIIAVFVMIAVNVGVRKPKI